mmetsp:Transcript_48394/g.158345  ORF Transcript_48394/g.158345 Transcript_48394/m.158345 type:complete len:267 (+) Transcript_48394:191-991(+)
MGWTLRLRAPTVQSSPPQELPAAHGGAHPAHAHPPHRLCARPGALPLRLGEQLAWPSHLHALHDSRPHQPWRGAVEAREQAGQRAVCTARPRVLAAVGAVHAGAQLQPRRLAAARAVEPNVGEHLGRQQSRRPSRCQSLEGGGHAARPPQSREAGQLDEEEGQPGGRRQRRVARGADVIRLEADQRSRRLCGEGRRGEREGLRGGERGANRPPRLVFDQLERDQPSLLLEQDRPSDFLPEDAPAPREHRRRADVRVAGEGHLIAVL